MVLAYEFAQARCACYYLPSFLVACNLNWNKNMGMEAIAIYLCFALQLRLVYDIYQYLSHYVGEAVWFPCALCSVCMTTNDEVKWDCTEKECAVKKAQIDDINADDLG